MTSSYEAAKLQAAPTPLSAEINALPDRIRSWIHELEARADPAGDLRELVLLRDTVKALDLLLDELSDARQSHVAGHRLLVDAEANVRSTSLMLKQIHELELLRDKGKAMDLVLDEASDSALRQAANIQVSVRDSDDGPTRANEEWKRGVHDALSEYRARIRAMQKPSSHIDATARSHVLDEMQQAIGLSFAIGVVSEAITQNAPLSAVYRVLRKKFADLNGAGGDGPGACIGAAFNE